MDDYRPLEDYTYGQDRDRHLERWNEKYRKPSRYHESCRRLNIEPLDCSIHEKTYDWIGKKKPWYTLKDVVPLDPFPLPPKNPKELPPVFKCDQTDCLTSDVDFRLWRTDENGKRIDVPKKKPVRDAKTGKLLCGSCQTWSPILGCKNCMELNMMSGLEWMKISNGGLSEEGELLAANLQERKRRDKSGSLYYNFEDEPLERNRWNKPACSVCKQGFLTHTHLSKCVIGVQDSLNVTGVEKRDVIDERILAGFTCDRHQRRGCFDCVHQSETGTEAVLRKRRQQVRNVSFCFTMSCEKDAVFDSSEMIQWVSFFFLVICVFFIHGN